MQGTVYAYKDVLLSVSTVSTVPIASHRSDHAAESRLQHRAHAQDLFGALLHPDLSVLQYY